MTENIPFSSCWVPFYILDMEMFALTYSILFCPVWLSSLGRSVSVYLEKLVGVEDIELFTLLQFDFALVSLALCPGPFLYSKKVFHLIFISQEPTIERLCKYLTSNTLCPQHWCGKCHTWPLVCKSRRRR